MANNGRGLNLTTLHQNEHNRKYNAKTVINAFDRHTSFNERLTAFRTSRFNPKLTWGRSELRFKEILSGSGSTTTTNGAGIISTGTTPSSSAELRTQERGQYMSGTEGEAGMGIRVEQGLIVDNKLQSGEEIRFQYCDNTYGFGYGIDETGIFIFRVNDGNFAKEYQDEWTADSLDGSGDANNPSGMTLDLEIGNIFQINFVWYGHGNINFYLNIKKPSDLSDNRILIHTIQVEGELSVKDPNQPISVACQNGSSGRDLIVHVGGLQFSVVDGNSSPNTRRTVTKREGAQITASQGTFVPVLAVRKKDTFNGRDNSIATFTDEVSITTSEKVYWYLSIGDSFDGTYGSITNIPDSETALETGNGALDGTSTSTSYRAIDQGVVSAGNTKTASSTLENRQSLGDDLQLILWVAKATGNNPTVDVYIKLEEEW